MMDPKLWQDYLRLLEQLTRTIHQLTGIEQNKIRAASQGNLEELETCMRQEQAMSLSLRGHDQKRDALLARMGLTGVPLRELERHAPVDLLMETKRVAETLRREYGLFQTASQVARSTLPTLGTWYWGSSITKGAGVIVLPLPFFFVRSRYSPVLTVAFWSCLRIEMVPRSKSTQSQARPRTSP